MNRFVDGTALDHLYTRSLDHVDRDRNARIKVAESRTGEE